MAIWAISDFHLSFGVKDKPMDVFGKNWVTYEEKIRENWLKNIKPEDVVLLAGDFSWGMYLDETIPDFEFLESLPGRKIMIKGNHDYWWETQNKLNVFKKKNGFNSVEFIHNNFVGLDNIAICGTRGWEIGSTDVDEETDKKAYEREKARLIRSLESASKAGYNEFIVMLHYNLGINQEYVDILKKYGVKLCVFGHLHGKTDYMEYEKDEIRFLCTSCDLINFMPILIKK